MSGIYNLVQGYTSTRECSEHYPKAHECDPTASRACALLAKQSLYWLHCKLSPEVKIVKKKKKIVRTLLDLTCKHRNPFCLSCKLSSNEEANASLEAV